MESLSNENTKYINNYVYMECGGHWLVELLDSYTKDDFTYFKLKAIETLRKSRVVKDITPGTEFEVSRRKGYEGWVSWHLKKYADYI